MHKIAALYGAIMAQARNPGMFSGLNVPDQFENRFELLTLHMFLVLRRLKTEGREGGRIAQLLTEYMVSDLDRSAREMGVGDVGVAKRMKNFMSGFYGRVLAYEKAWESPDGKEILRALDRNLYANMDTSIPTLEKMREYLQKQQAALATQPFSQIADGKISFAD